MKRFFSNRILRLIVLGNLLVAGILCTATWMSQRAHYQADMDFGVSVTTNQARSLSLELAAEMRLVDNALATITRRYQTRSADSLQAAEHLLPDLIHEQRPLIPFVAALRTADRHGRVQPAPGSAEASFSVANREYFRQSVLTDGMVISPPLVSLPLDKWVIVLSRRRQSADGSFQGIVYATVTAEHFQKLFHHQSFGQDSAISLRTDDHRLVARFSATRKDTMAGVGGTAVSSEYYAALRRNREHGWYIAPTRQDGVERITAYQRLTGYPLTVYTGLGIHTFLASWRASALRAWAFTCLSILLIGLGSISLYRLQRRKHLAMLKVSELLREQRLFIDNDLIGIARLRARRILWVNQAIPRILKYPASALVGAPMRMLYPDDETYDRLGAIAYEALHKHDKFHAQIQLLTGEGSLLWVDISGVRLDTDDSLWIFVDIDGLKRNEEAARHQAKHDALTGLANRLGLEERLEAALAAASRTGERIAVCFMDLDGFKPVNDTLGHDAGDEVLRIISARLRAQERACDCVARLGGDEFVILLTGLKSADDAVSAMQRCLDSIQQRIVLDSGSGVNVGGSIGIALNLDTDNSADLLQRADEAMYAAKRAGKAQIVVAADTVPGWQTENERRPQYQPTAGSMAEKPMD